MAFGRSSKIAGSIGLLIEQRAKPFDITFAIDLRTPEGGHTLIRTLAWRTVSIKIVLSFHPALPPQNSFIIKLHADSFEEENLETTDTFKRKEKYP